MISIDHVILRRVSIPLLRPYENSVSALKEYDVFVVEVTSGDRVGWGEAVVRAGYTDETPDQAWTFGQAMGPALIGASTDAAKSRLLEHMTDNSHSASAMVMALEMLEQNPLLTPKGDVRVPLLVPVQSSSEAEIEQEIEGHIADGFRTLKVKVGFDVDEDLKRIRLMQRIGAGRVTFRMDANQSFTREDALRFAAGLDPEGLELFEQPCAKEDWESAAAVIKASQVPIMLDEAIVGDAEIRRAAEIGAAYVKLKLKKCGGAQRLRESLLYAQSLGLRTVAGDGVATDLTSWMEACAAYGVIDNAGEMNGFLKLTRGLFAAPLEAVGGAIWFSGDFNARIDRDALDAMTTHKTHFGETTVS